MQEDLDKKKNNGIVEEKYLKYKKQLKTQKQKNNEFRNMGKL